MRSRAALLPVLLGLLAPVPAAAAGRGGVGKLTIPFDTGHVVHDRVGALAADASGRLVAAISVGPGHRWAVVRHLAGGMPDPGFGTGGRVTVPSSTLSEVLSVLALDDGRALLVGTSASQPGLVVERLTAAGDPDPSFGSGGVAALPALSPGCSSCRLAAAGLDGSLVVAGYAGEAPGHPAVERLTSGGVPDPAFGQDGLAVWPYPGRALGLAPTLTLGVVAYGTAGRPDDPTPRPSLMGLDVLGRPDPLFGTGGLVDTPLPPSDILVSGADILVAGARPAPDGRVSVTRYLLTGTLDPTYGDRGTADTGLALAPRLLPAGDGRVLLADAGDSRAVFVRLTADGRLDPGVPPRGVATTPMGFGGASYQKGLVALPGHQAFSATAVVRRADGSLVMGGAAQVAEQGAQASRSSSEAALVGFRPDFQLDPSFGPPPYPLSVTVRVSPRRLSTLRARGLRLALFPAERGLAIVRATAAGRLIARGTVPFFTTGPQAASVRLTAAGHRLALTRPGLSVKVRVTSYDLAGNSGTTVARVTLRR